MIAKTAIIEKGAKIADNVEIGEYCIIGKDVEIQSDCVIKNNVTISGVTTIGSGTKIYSFAVVGSDPQDLKYRGEPTRLVIGKNNIIREFATINTGTISGSEVTTIGDNNLLMAYAHVAHDCIVGDHCILANVATLGGHVRLGNYVNIGGLAAVHQFVQIGDGSMIGGTSGVVQDIPPYTVAYGFHATIKSINKVRLRRNFDADTVDLVSNVYKKILASSSSRDIAKQLLEEYKGNEIVENICDFIMNNTRGIAIDKGEHNG